MAEIVLDNCRLGREGRGAAVFESSMECLQLARRHAAADQWILDSVACAWSASSRTAMASRWRPTRPGWRTSIASTALHRSLGIRAALPAEEIGRAHV